MSRTFVFVASPLATLGSQFRFHGNKVERSSLPRPELGSGLIRDCTLVRLYFKSAKRRTLKA